MTVPLAPSTGRPAADLLDAGDCSAQCLLAREPGGTCVCRCGGEYHGALLDAAVPKATGWWAALPGFTPHRHGMRRSGRGPVLETAADFRELWRGDVTGPLAYVRPQGTGKWAAHSHGATAWHEGKNIVHGGFVEGLVLTGRCDAGSPGQDASVYGFCAWQEAQAAARVLFAIDWMWEEDVLPCLRALAAALPDVPHPRLSRAIEVMERAWVDADNAIYDDPLVGSLMRVASGYRTRRALEGQSA